MGLGSEMAVVFAARIDVDPGDLGVNIRYRTNAVIHPRARAAQEAIILKLKPRLSGIRELPNPALVELYFAFSSKRYDIDGPIKRTLDAIEAAAQAVGLDWNDSSIDRLLVKKLVSDEPRVSIIMLRREEAYGL